MSPADYRAARERLGLTQAELATRLGLPRTSIVKREAGAQRIIAEHTLALDALSSAPKRPARGKRSAMPTPNDQAEPHGQ